MPTKIIPLVDNFIMRGPTSGNAPTKDILYVNTALQVIKNPVSNTASAYLNKRQGWETITTTGDALPTTINAIISTKSRASTLYVVGTGSTDFFCSVDITTGAVVTNLGSTIGTCLSLLEIIIGTKTYVLTVSGGYPNGYGWYHVNDAIATFTGDRTSGSAIVNNISSTTGLYSGQLASGTGFTAANRILTVDSATQVTMTTNATSGAPTSTTFTTERAAQILDSGFPTNIVSGFTTLDGYVFILTIDGFIYQSALNNVTSWDAANRIACDAQPDIGLALVTTKGGLVAAFGRTTIQFFRNAGNPSGSVLSRVGYTNIGLHTTFNIASYTTGWMQRKICQVGDSFYFIGVTQSQGSVGLYKLDEMSVEKVSSQAADVAMGVSPQATISTIKMFGQDAIIVASDVTEVAKIILVYFPDSKIWMTLTAADTLNGFRAICYSNDRRLYFLAGDTTLSVMDPATTPVYQDRGAAYTMTIQTELIVPNKGKGFIINSVELLADTQSSGATQIEISRDDYTTYQVLGSFQLTNRRKKIPRGGYCRSHAIFRLTDSGNQAWRGQALVVDYTPCAT